MARTGLLKYTLQQVYVFIYLQNEFDVFRSQIFLVLYYYVSI